jgi:quinol monooxygenase YgiN
MESLITTMRAVPGSSIQLVADLKKGLQTARAFPGCLSMELYVSESNSDEIFLVEQWKSKNAHAKYAAKIGASGLLDEYMLMMIAPMEERWVRHISPGKKKSAPSKPRKKAVKKAPAKARKKTTKRATTSALRKKTVKKNATRGRR